MKRLSVLFIAALALLLPVGAAAKGPSAATISGPGLAAPLAITGLGEGDASTDLGRLVTDGGFFAQTFGSSSTQRWSRSSTRTRRAVPSRTCAPAKRFGATSGRSAGGTEARRS
jgi:hypothetical protein